MQPVARYLFVTHWNRCNFPYRSGLGHGYLRDPAPPLHVAQIGGPTHDGAIACAFRTDC